MKEWVGLLAFAVGLLPTIVVLIRRHHDRLAIVVLNLLAGVPLGYFVMIRPELESAKMWMMMVAFGMWSAALVWACIAQPRD